MHFSKGLLGLFILSLFCCLVLAQDYYRRRHHGFSRHRHRFSRRHYRHSRSFYPYFNPYYNPYYYYLAEQQGQPQTAGELSSVVNEQALPLQQAPFDQGVVQGVAQRVVVRRQVVGRQFSPTDLSQGFGQSSQSDTSSGNVLAPFNVVSGQQSTKYQHAFDNDSTQNSRQRVRSKVFVKGVTYEVFPSDQSQQVGNVVSQATPPPQGNVQEQQEPSPSQNVASVTSPQDTSSPESVNPQGSASSPSVYNANVNQVTAQQDSPHAVSAQNSNPQGISSTSFSPNFVTQPGQTSGQGSDSASGQEGQSPSSNASQRQY